MPDDADLMGKNEIAVLPKLHDTPTMSNSDRAMAWAKHPGFSGIISDDSQTHSL